MTRIDVLSVDKANRAEMLQLHSGLHARYIRIGVSVASMAIDLLAVLAVFVIASLLTQRAMPRGDDALIFLLSAVLFVIVGFYARTYGVLAFKSNRVAARRILHSWAMTFALILLVSFTVKSSSSLSRSIFLLAAVFGPAALIAIRSVTITFIRSRLGRAFVCELLIEDRVTADVPPWFDRVSAEDLDLIPDLHNPMSLHNFSCVTSRYDRVLIASPQGRRADWAFYLQSVGCNGELVIPELSELALYGDHGGRRLPTIVVAVGPLELPDRILKRLLDLALTVPAIILLAPLLIAVAIGIKLDSKGPVLFKQSRMGRNNRLFEVYKFRSMRHEQSDLAGSRSAARDDDRVTRIGRFIRATSIDELPQLFNVLNGDMALVGPRPHALGSRAGRDLFWQVDHRYWLRHSIKPGITGLAQVRGYRGATDQRDDLSNRLYSDLEYLANWSIFRDLAILVRTATVLVHNKAY